MHRLISWTCVIIWAAIIFSLSSQVAEQSDRLSTGVTEFVAETLENITQKAETLDVHHLNRVLRKNAHFSLYLILAILAANAFVSSGNSLNKSLIFSFLFCVLYAISDEIHQLYVPGRSAQMTDVFIDSFGAGTGLLIYRFTVSARKLYLKRKLT